MVPRSCTVRGMCIGLSAQRSAMLLAAALVGTAGLGAAGDQAPATPPPPSAPANRALRFERQEIRGTYGVGYAVNVADMNGDTRPDVVAISGTQVTWYENPTWREHVALEGQTPKDNVSFAVHDIDRDGRMDVAIAATWNPRDTRGGGTLHWIQQAAAGAPWTLRDVSSEPTLHRIRWADVDGRPFTTGDGREWARTHRRAAARPRHRAARLERPGRASHRVHASRRARHRAMESRDHRRHAAHRPQLHARALHAAGSRRTARRQP